MGDAYIALQAAHMARLEHILHQPIVFVHVKGVAIASDDTSGILAAMLQNQQPVIEQLINWILANYTNNSAHEVSTLKKLETR